MNPKVTAALTRRWSRQRQRGFTLLEVMVALGIFAVCASVLLKQSGLSSRQSLILDNKTQAIWLAENKLAELQLQKQWPSNDTKTDTLTQGQREWQVITTVAKTSNKHLRSVTVQVSLADNEDAVVAELLGFVGEY